MAGRKSTSRSVKGTRPEMLPRRFHSQPCTKTMAGPGPSPSRGMNQPLSFTPSVAGKVTLSYSRPASVGVWRRGVRAPTSMSLVSTRGLVALVARDCLAMRVAPQSPMPGGPLEPPGIICRSSHALAAISQSASESCSSLWRRTRMR